MKNKFKKIICGVLATIFTTASMTSVASAVTMTVSPMNQRIILNPGEVYEGSFNVGSPADATGTLNYEVKIQPFYVDENYDIFYEEEGDYNQIVDWTTIKNPEGSMEPNNSSTIYYSIDVPEDAPAGGQYLSLTTMAKSMDNAGSGFNITSIPAVAHIIYAEIAGTTERSGEIFGESVPSFVFGGDIVGSSSVKNTGNVHSTAKYTLKVFPLFSDEEVYTNEEEPVEKTVLPDRTLYNETAWPETPWFGVFNVVYTVEFEGVVKEVSKMVIVCPIWLLFIVIFAVVMLVVWFVARSRNRKSSSRKK